MKINKLTIKGFRGFNKEESIQLNSDVILIYGLNGSGKSSFTEALEWLFFEEISRQRLSRCKSEYQFEEYLKNLFYTSTDNPFVEAYGTINGKFVTIRKELAPHGTSRFIDGKEVENFEALNMNLENYFRPMLAQTEIKALVDSEQKDRWEQLSSILGQDDLTKLREALINLRNIKRDENYKKQEIKINSILNDISELSSLSLLANLVQAFDLQQLTIELQKIVESRESQLEKLLKEIKLKQKNLLNTELGKRVGEISYKDTTKLKEYLQEFERELEKLESEAIKSISGGHDHDYLEFIKLGKNFSKPPECPYCLEKSLTTQRFEDIEKSLEKGKDAQLAKSAFDQGKNTIGRWIEIFPSRITEFIPSQNELKIIAQKFLDIEEAELAASVQDLDKKITNFITDQNRKVIGQKNSRLSHIENKYFHNNKPLVEAEETTEEVIIQISEQVDSLVLEWNNLKKLIANKIPLVENVNNEELKKWLTLEKLINFMLESGAFIKQKELLDKIDSIQEKLEQYEKSEVSRLLNVHAKEIKMYYEKLNPGDHVQFSGIEVKGGVRRQAKLKADAFGKEVNPVTFFSEAHTNSLALSIYFPQRVDRNDTWETVILDDPVQSMDENHSQALIDILVDIATKKQIIVLTHSKSFFKRLCARFGHLKPEVYSFFYNEENGPSIILDEGEIISYLRLIDESCNKGDPKSLETASTHLRKAIESVCFQFLLDKGLSFTKARKVQKSGLDSLFAEVEKLGLDPSETGKLKSVLDTSHSDSHAWSIADTTPGGLKKGVEYIKEIYNSYLK